MVSKSRVEVVSRKFQRLRNPLIIFGRINGKALGYSHLLRPSDLVWIALKSKKQGE